MQAHGHERVLQRSPRAGVGVDVAGRHAGHPQPPRQPGQPPVASPVVAQERPLELDPQPLAPERLEQPPQGRLVVHPAQRAAAQADQALGVLEQRRSSGTTGAVGGPPAALARMRVRAGQDAAEVGPAAGVLDQQRQMAPVVEVDLGAVDRAQPQRPGGDGELHRARDRVVVGQRQRLVAELQRGRDELIGQRGAVQEREGGVAVELGVHVRTHVRIIGPDVGRERLRQPS